MIQARSLGLRATLLGFELGPESGVLFVSPNTCTALQSLHFHVNDAVESYRSPVK